MRVAACACHPSEQAMTARDRLRIMAQSSRMLPSDATVPLITVPLSRLRRVTTSPSAAVLQCQRVHRDGEAAVLENDHRRLALRSRGRDRG